MIYNIYQYFTYILQSSPGNHPKYEPLLPFSLPFFFIQIPPRRPQPFQLIVPRHQDRRLLPAFQECLRRKIRRSIRAAGAKELPRSKQYSLFWYLQKASKFWMIFVLQSGLLSFPFKALRRVAYLKTYLPFLNGLDMFFYGV